jgi:hypothetical protein
MSEVVAHADAFPGDDRLRFLPAQFSDGRGGIGDAFVDIYSFLFGFDALDLASFYGQDRDALRTPEEDEGGEQAEDYSFHDDMWMIVFTKLANYFL